MGNPQWFGPQDLGMVPEPKPEDDTLGPKLKALQDRMDLLLVAVKEMNGR